MAVQPFKLILVLTNFSILAFVLVLIFDHLCANNNLKSWALLFHILCFLWLCFRGMFWLTTMTATASWGSADYFFLYWMPTPIEFGAFMVLPLYFAQVLYPDKWKSLWGWIQPIYAFLVAGMTAVQAIWIIMACILQNEIIDQNDDECGDDCFHSEISSGFFRITQIVCFFVLAVIQALYGRQLRGMDPQRYQRLLVASQEVMSIVTLILVISFASRSIYQLLAEFKVYILPNVPLQGDQDTDIMTLLAFCFWDYIPTILVIATITSRSITGNASLVASRSRNLTRHCAKTRLLRDGGLYPDYTGMGRDSSARGSGGGRGRAASEQDSSDDDRDYTPSGGLFDTEEGGRAGQGGQGAERRAAEAAGAAGDELMSLSSSLPSLSTRHPSYLQPVDERHGLHGGQVGGNYRDLSGGSGASGSGLIIGLEAIHDHSSRFEDRLRIPYNYLHHQAVGGYSSYGSHSSAGAYHPMMRVGLGPDDLPTESVGSFSSGSAKGYCGGTGAAAGGTCKGGDGGAWEGDADEDGSGDHGTGTLARDKSVVYFYKQQRGRADSISSNASADQYVSTDPIPRTRGTMLGIRNRGRSMPFALGDQGTHSEQQYPRTSPENSKDNDLSTPPTLVQYQQPPLKLGVVGSVADTGEKRRGDLTVRKVSGDANDIVGSGGGHSLLSGITSSRERSGSGGGGGIGSGGGSGSGLRRSMLKAPRESKVYSEQLANRGSRSNSEDLATPQPTTIASLAAATATFDALGEIECPATTPRVGGLGGGGGGGGQEPAVEHPERQVLPPASSVGKCDDSSDDNHAVLNIMVSIDAGPAGRIGRPVTTAATGAAASAPLGSESEQGSGDNPPLSAGYYGYHKVISNTILRDNSTAGGADDNRTVRYDDDGAGDAGGGTVQQAVAEADLLEQHRKLEQLQQLKQKHQLEQMHQLEQHQLEQNQLEQHQQLEQQHQQQKLQMSDVQQPRPQYSNYAAVNFGQAFLSSSPTSGGNAGSGSLGDITSGAYYFTRQNQTVAERGGGGGGGVGELDSRCQSGSFGGVFASSAGSSIGSSNSFFLPRSLSTPERRAAADEAARLRHGVPRSRTTSASGIDEAGVAAASASAPASAVFVATGEGDYYGSPGQSTGSDPALQGYTYRY